MATIKKESESGNSFFVRFLFTCCFVSCCFSSPLSPLSLSSLHRRCFLYDPADTIIDRIEFSWCKLLISQEWFFIYLPFTSASTSVTVLSPPSIVMVVLTKCFRQFCVFDSENHLGQLFGSLKMLNVLFWYCK